MSGRRLREEAPEARSGGLQPPEHTRLPAPPVPPPMAGGGGGAGAERLAALVEEAAVLAARRRGASRAGMAAAAVCSLLALGVAFDLAAALPAGVRVAVAAALAAGALAALLLPLLARRPSEGEAARLAEAALGDADRRLTAGRELAGMTDPLAVAAAARLAGELPELPLSAGLPASGARRWWLAAAAGAAAVLVTALVVPGALTTVLPRFLDPLGDHPPWARTRLAWVEIPALARPGESLRVVVGSDGPALPGLRLRGQAAALGLSIDLPMAHLGEGRWAATLTPLPVPAGADPHLLLWAESPATRTVRRRIAIDPAPVITRLDCSAIQPAYARLEPERQAAAGGRPAAFALLPGAAVTLAPQANRPLKALRLFGADGVERRLALAAGSARLEEPAPGLWQVAGEADDGSIGPAVPALQVSRREDRPPEVWIEEPGDGGYATPNAVVPLVIGARDDLGLAAVTRWLVTDEGTRQEIPETAAGTSDTVRTQVRLGDVAPGTVVRLGAVARDTRPPDGQLSPAAEISLRIIPLATWNELVRDQLASDALIERYRPLLDELAKADAELAAALADGARPGDPRLQAVAERAAALAAEVAAMRTPEPLFAAEPDVQAELERQLAELAAAARAGRARDGSGDRLREDIAELTAKAEADALGEALQELAAAAEETAREAGDLAGLPKTDATRARLRALAERQEAIDEALAAWREQARATAGRSAGRDPGLAGRLNALADGADAAAAGAGLGDSARQARAGRAGQAAPPGRNAAEALRRMAGEPCQGGQCRDGWCDAARLSGTRRQLARLARLGLGLGGTPDGSGGGGALGMSGGNAFARPGGQAPPNRVPLFGPETLSTRRSDRSRAGADRSRGGAGVVVDADGRMRPATAYRREVRTATADPGAQLAPHERRTVDDYHRRLSGDALGPAPEKP